MSPNSPTARAQRATNVNDALQRCLDTAMGMARLSHNDYHPVGTLVWVETDRQCNGHKEMVVKCKGGWVAFDNTYPLEKGVVESCESVGLPPPTAPYKGCHQNTARQFRRVISKYEIGTFLWRGPKGALVFRLAAKIAAKLPTAKRTVDRSAEGMCYALADALADALA